ncbi:hypothetical protein BJ546DRAFT_969959 [Cryomyces antarcticus]
MDKEEPRAWQGWWNETIVELVELTMQQNDALCVLLTGRAEGPFAELVKLMVKSKKLEFDMVCLKPIVGPANQKFPSTMAFKQAFLSDLVHTYKDADEIRIYEDRPKHTKGFRDFFTDLNRKLLSSAAPTPRQAITAEVVQVAEDAKSLDPITEVAEVQRMINKHNVAVRASNGLAGVPPWQIKRTVFYTGYLISPEDTERLLTLVSLPPNTPDGEVRFLANNILITPRPAPKSILDKVGGIGNKVTWRVTGTAVLEGKLWAAKVQPVSDLVSYYSENPTPTIVLALRRNAKPIDANRIQNWQPVPEDKAFEFQTTVGEKVLLRVEAEQSNEDEWESAFPNRSNQRKHPREEDFPSLGPSNGIAAPHTRPQVKAGQGVQPKSKAFDKTRKEGRYRPAYDLSRPQQNNNRGNYNNSGRGGRGGARDGPHRGGRGGRGGQRGGGRGRGRGGGQGYRSLDDNGGAGYGGGGMQY